MTIRLDAVVAAADLPGMRAISAERIECLNRTATRAAGRSRNAPLPLSPERPGFLELIPTRRSGGLRTSVMVNYTATLRDVYRAQNQPQSLRRLGFPHVQGAFMARRRNGYLKAVTYTALLEAAAMLRVRRCAHVMTAMTDHAVCVVCGAAFPWRRGEGGSDAED